MTHTKSTHPDKQREELLDSARHANRDEPRNFKEDALQEKVVSVEPDGTGPTSTGTFDAPEDEKRGSGNHPGEEAEKTSRGEKPTSDHNQG